MALLVEGLGIGGDTSIEEYIIGPADELDDGVEAGDEKDRITLYGPDAGLSWVAKPVTGGQSSLALISRQGSLANQSVPLMDPLVTLFGSVHEKNPDTGSMRSMLFPTFGSMFSTTDPHIKHEQWDEESLQREGDDYPSDGGAADSDDNLHSPLISRQTTSLEKDMPVPTSHGTVLSMRNQSSLMPGTGETVGNTGIGGGWQLAWKWSESKGEFKRIYLHEEGAQASRRGSLASLTTTYDAPEESGHVQAAGLVSQSALYPKELKDEHPVGPAMVHPEKTASKGPVWTALLDPGVKRALVVGIGIQLLQQVDNCFICLY